MARPGKYIPRGTKQKKTRTHNPDGTPVAVGKNFTILTDEISNQICFNLNRGAPIRYAVAAVGVSEKAFYEWMQKGRDDDAEYIPIEPYYSFMINVRKAVGEKVCDAMAGVFDAGETSWPAFMTWGERLYPKDFARRQDAIGADKTVININLPDSTGASLPQGAIQVEIPATTDAK